MNVIQAMEGVKRHVQTLMVASSVPVQLVLYLMIQMALIVMVSSLAVDSQCIMSAYVYSLSFS